MPFFNLLFFRVTYQPPVTVTPGQFEGINDEQTYSFTNS